MDLHDLGTLMEIAAAAEPPAVMATFGPQKPHERHNDVKTPIDSPAKKSLNENGTRSGVLGKSDSNIKSIRI